MRRCLVAVVSSGLMLGFAATGGALAPAAFAAPITVNFTTTGQDFWVVPSGVTSISVSLTGSAADPLPAGILKGNPGRGVSITVTRAVTPLQIIDISLDARQQNNCQYGGNTSGLTSWAGAAAAVQVRGTTDIVVAGGGGAPGCADASGGVGGDGGDAGVPSAVGVVANGGVGGNGLGGSPLANGGLGGTTTGGAGGSGGAGPGSPGGNPRTLYGLLATGGVQNLDNGAKGGAGGAGYAGGGSGAAGGFSIPAAGGGGGSSIYSGSWVLTAAAANSTPGTASVSITYTQAASSDADLSGLVLSSGTLSPVFASATTSYSASVANGVSSVTVTPTVSDANATVTVNGSAVTSGQASGAISLNVGSNTITTVVTAQGGTTTKTYTITVTRAAASSDADLSGLVLSSGSLSPVFASATTSYSASVANGVSSVTVTPTVSDANATVTVESVAVTSGQASGPISLNVGLNSILVEVTAQNGTTTKTYTVFITRGQSPEVEFASPAPPTWFQAYSRPTMNSECSSGYYPSYAEWPNGGRGGWTCERRMFWNVNENIWNLAPGFYST